jgi:hypothetical protein
MLRRSLSPWIDHILARIGELILFVASGSHGQVANMTESIAIRKELERDAARAACQLPGEKYQPPACYFFKKNICQDCCVAFPAALNARYLSRAARRLLVRLLFGLFVMQPITLEQELNQWYEFLYRPLTICANPLQYS